MREFLAKTWKTIALKFLKRLKETGNCAWHLIGANRVKQLLSKLPPMRSCLGFIRSLSSRMVAFAHNAVIVSG